MSETVTAKPKAYSELDDESKAEVKQRAIELSVQDPTVNMACFVMLHSMRLYALGMASLDRKLNNLKEPFVEPMKALLAQYMREQACKPFERSQVIHETGTRLMAYLQNEMVTEAKAGANADAMARTFIEKARRESEVPIGFEIDKGWMTLDRERSLVLVGPSNFIQATLSRAIATCAAADGLVLVLAETVGAASDIPGCLALGTGKWAGATSNRTHFVEFMDKVQAITKRPVDLLVMDDIAADQISGERLGPWSGHALKVLHDWAKQNGTAVIAGVSLPTGEVAGLEWLDRVAKHNRVMVFTSTGQPVLHTTEERDGRVEVSDSGVHDGSEAGSLGSGGDPAG